MQSGVKVNITDWSVVSKVISKPFSGRAKKGGEKWKRWQDKAPNSNQDNYESANHNNKRKSNDHKNPTLVRHRMLLR